MGDLSKEIKQLEKMLADIKEVKQTYSTIRERMYPPKQEKRDLPSDVPRRRQLTQTAKKIETVEKSINRVLRSKKKRIRPVKVNKKVRAFLKLDIDYYDSTMLLRVIHLYTLYNDLSDGSTFRTDRILRKLLGEGPHDVISVNRLISPLYKKKRQKDDNNVHDDDNDTNSDDAIELQAAREFLEEEITIINELTMLKDEYRNLTSKISQLKKKRKELNNKDRELLDERISSMKKEAKYALKVFKNKASNYRVFQESD